MKKMLNKYRVLIKQDDIPIIPLDENAHEHLISEVRNEQFNKDIELFKAQYAKQTESEIVQGTCFKKKMLD